MENLFENVRYLIENGFKLIVPVPDMFCREWTNEDFEDLENEFKKIKNYLVKNKISDINFDELMNEFKPKGVCTGGEDYYNINAIGDIYPCTFVVGDDTHWIGNVYDGLDHKRVAKITCINHNRDKVEGCQECRLAMYCSNTRCLLENYAVTGDYYKPNLVKCNLMNIKYNLCDYMKSSMSDENRVIYETTDQ